VAIDDAGEDVRNAVEAFVQAARLELATQS
jgi:hypothetical protein